MTACDCGGDHCQTCAVKYGYTAVHFCDGICAFGHAEPDR